VKRELSFTGLSIERQVITFSLNVKSAMDTTRKLYQDLSEEYPNDVRPFLDRDVVDESSLNDDQIAWRHDGVLIKEKFLPNEIVENYIELRQKVKLDIGWKDPCPYLRHDELKDIALYGPLVDKMEELIGEPMGLHLNLTGWVSTQRRFHSDDYLNPEFVHSHYVAIWIALEDIDPASGPFQFVRGSHKWPPLRRHKLFSMIPVEQAKAASWPSTTENIVALACEKEIERRGSQIETFLGRKGDVLFWHGRLLHQGSCPTIPGTPRRALIAHYSAMNHRPDMKMRRIYEKTSKPYFYFPEWDSGKLDKDVLAKDKRSLLDPLKDVISRVFKY
jgi:hypothetical protein